MATTETEKRTDKPVPKLAIALRFGTTALALAGWFWSQSLIGARQLPASGIGDWTHVITASANHYLLTHTTAANALLIVSSGVIDLMAVFLLGRWLFQAETRPFLGLVMVLGLRQLMQACVSLPAPPSEIWHNPGFPSLLVTYGVSNDFSSPPIPRSPSSLPPNWYDSANAGCPHSPCFWSFSRLQPCWSSGPTTSWTSSRELSPASTLPIWQIAFPTA